MSRAEFLEYHEERTDELSAAKMMEEQRRRAFQELEQQRRGYETGHEQSHGYER